MTMEELQKDEKLQKQIADAENYEKVAEILKSRGVDVTVDQLKKSAEENADGELREDEMEEVAGGLWRPPIYVKPRIPNIFKIISRLWI